MSNKEPINLLSKESYDYLKSIYNDEKTMKKFGKWIVESDGNMCYDDFYWIMADMLKENNWMRHLSEKAWINWNEFIPAYFYALSIIGCKRLEIVIEY